MDVHIYQHWQFNIPICGLNITFPYFFGIIIKRNYTFNIEFSTFNIYNNINLDDENELISLIISIKNNYEDNWKKINQINRSVKLPLNISVDANDYQKNKLFKEFLHNTEFVSNFFIKDFNNKKINYRIIFNGSPARFLDLCNKNNILIDTTNQIWQLN